MRSRHLINLASAEYFKAVHPNRLKGDVITPEFKERKNGQYRVIGIFAKSARGRLSRFVIKNRLTDPEALKVFDEDGYQFNAALSSSAKWVFTRG